MSKAFERRKEWKRACRRKVIEGMTNDGQGNFVEDRYITDKNNIQHMRAGYKVGEFSRHGRTREN